MRQERESLMGSSGAMPWYNRPARPFPALVWVRQRYGFRLPPLRFCPQADQPEGLRPFPAKVWVEQRRADS